jgi:hypothetical protein
MQAKLITSPVTVKTNLAPVLRTMMEAAQTEKASAPPTLVSTHDPLSHSLAVKAPVKEYAGKRTVPAGRDSWFLKASGLEVIPATVGQVIVAESLVRPNPVNTQLMVLVKP